MWICTLNNGQSHGEDYEKPVYLNHFDRFKKYTIQIQTQLSQFTAQSGRLHNRNEVSINRIAHEHFPVCILSADRLFNVFFGAHFLVDTSNDRSALE